MIYKSINDLVGKTPMVEIKDESFQGRLIAKLEFFNPGGSVKDRISLAMLEKAEKDGIISTSKTTIIEATSGNTGVGLAMVAAAKGYKLILTMPDTMSVERRKLLKAFGAHLELTEGKKGMPGAIERAEKLADEDGNSFIPSQFYNEANPQVHKETTAMEVLEDTNGEIDYFVAGVGTGGTITGVGQVLKEKLSDVSVIAVEPEDSPVLSGGSPGPHKIQGIGAGFVPKVLRKEVIDTVSKVGHQTAFEASRWLAKNHGILTGISSGAALSVAIDLAKDAENKGKNIVVLLPDNGERYLSTPLYETV
ncbi:cysteine synthase A [Proteinivorax hydrogeniformans]|uniref:Cysteine synthase n=1 Tax=Proteinivorax hydrogeniformans TaxID=1826727 RepID=A0AAU8HR49_9FIRM